MNDPETRAERAEQRSSHARERAEQTSGVRQLAWRAIARVRGWEAYDLGLEQAELDATAHHQATGEWPTVIEE